MAMIDGIEMKDEGTIIPFHLEKQTLQQLYNNQMGIGKTRLLGHELVYWVNINADIKSTMKQCATCLDYQQTQPYKRSHVRLLVVMYFLKIIISYYV